LREQLRFELLAKAAIYFEYMVFGVMRGLGIIWYQAPKRFDLLKELLNMVSTLHQTIICETIVVIHSFRSNRIIRIAGGVIICVVEAPVSFSFVGQAMLFVIKGLVNQKIGARHAELRV